MKHLLNLTFILLLAACGERATLPTQQPFLILPDGKFQVGTEATDFPGALAKLGSPATTQVNISACSNATMQTIVKVKADLEAAGYDRIGFATISARDNVLCANNSFKPKPLRGSA